VNLLVTARRTVLVVDAGEPCNAPDHGCGHAGGPTTDDHYVASVHALRLQPTRPSAEPVRPDLATAASSPATPCSPHPASPPPNTPLVGLDCASDPDGAGTVDATGRSSVPGVRAAGNVVRDLDHGLPLAPTAHSHPKESR
jgi:hypothetical protein